MGKVAGRWGWSISLTLVAVLLLCACSLHGNPAREIIPDGQVPGGAPQSPQLAGVPMPPADAAVGADVILARRGSISGSVVRLGRDYLSCDPDAGPGADETALILTADAGYDRCWALYCFDNLLPADNPNLLTCETAAPPAPDPYYIAWSDYSTTPPSWRWQYLSAPSGSDAAPRPAPGGVPINPVSPGGNVYILAAVLGEGQEAQAAIARITLSLDAGTLPPASILASDGTNGSCIHVSWSAAPAGVEVSGYCLERAASAAGPYALLAQLDAATLDYTDAYDAATNPLPYAQLLYYRVRSCSSASPLGGPASVSDAGWRVLKPQVSGFAASDGAYSDRVQLSWDADPGAAGYRIQYKSPLWGSFAELAEVSGELNCSFAHSPANPPTLPYDPPATYSYRVQALCPGGESAQWSAADDGWGGDFRADWSQYGREPSHARNSPWVGPANDDKLWSCPTGARVRGGAAVSSAGVLYCGSLDNRLYAIRDNGLSFTVKWYLNTGGDVLATPAISATGVIYCAGEDGQLRALVDNGASYTQRWACSAGGGIPSSPVLADSGRLYFGARDHKLYALEDNGSSYTKCWEFLASGEIVASPALGADGTVYFGALDGSLYALADQGGSAPLKWQLPLGSALTGGPAVGADGTIYIGSQAGTLFAVQDSGSSATLKWSYDAGAPIDGSPALGAGGRVYFGTEGGTFIALTDTGDHASLAWSFAAGGAIRSDAALTTGSYLYFGSDDGYVYALRDRGASYSLLWSYYTGRSVAAPPSIGDGGQLYIGSDDNNLHAFGLGNAPVAFLSADAPSGAFPREVSFDASASFDVDGSLLRFDWDWEGDGEFDLINGGAKPSYYYVESGIYQATVRVVDNELKEGMAVVMISE